MSPTKIALSPEEVDILIEALRPALLWNWHVADKAFATEAYALRDRLVLWVSSDSVSDSLAERSERRAHAEALADSDCPDDIILCDVCGYDIDGDDPAFACYCSSDDDCPDDIALGVGSEHPER
jgi:hypothetical protein